MARPDETLARGAARGANQYDQVYDEGLNGQRRDPRDLRDPRARTEAPMRGPNQTGIPMAPDTPREPPRAAQPGVTPRFDPYLPSGNGQAPGRQAPPPPQQHSQQHRADPRLEFPPQAPAQQPYRADPLAGALPGQQPASERRYAPPPLPPQQQAPREAAPRPVTAGRPGQPNGQPMANGAMQTSRQPAQGYPAPAQGYNGAPAPQSQQEIVPPVRGRAADPYLEAPRRAPIAPPQQPQAQIAGRQPQGYAQDGHGDDRYADAANEQHLEDDEYEDEAEDLDADEPARPRGGRMMYALGALVAAAVIGGGLGLGYKYMLPSGDKAGKVPVVQAEKAPAKTLAAADAKPADASKKSKSIMDRAGSETGDGATVVSSQEDVALTSTQGSADPLPSPRKVSTVVVTPGQPIDSQPAASGAEFEAVPGIGFGGEPDPAPEPAAKAVKLSDPAAAAKAKIKEAVKAAAVTETATQTSEAVAELADPAAAPVKLAGAAKTVKKAAAPAPQPETDPADSVAAEAAAEAPAPAKPAPAKPTKLASVQPAATPKPAAGGGYLIQVRSTKTQAEALAFFADLQQQYGQILGGAQPDIQEADLGAKGVWFRLRIGPPGSGGAAKDMCVKLKAAGLKDCIVAVY